MKRSIFLMLTSILITSCTQNQLRNTFVQPDMTLAAQQLQSAITNIPDSLKTYGPRTVNDSRIQYIRNILDWTVGFFPGSLWYMYDFTKDENWRKEAERFTLAIEDAKYNTEHHDVGFVIQSSFGNAYRLTQNPHFKEVMIKGAQSLSTRFDPRVGCILSWDADKGWQSQRGWQYPVIIDNMMNLELLFNATTFTGDSSFYNIAVSHADVTMKNHFRNDYSSYHVVDYDSITGVARNHHTAQGYAHESAWARGQAWGLYGYVVCYRETGDERYLKQAENIANWWLTQKNLPEDMIPYWDFNAPDIPDAPRDASAAAITASALVELASFKTPKRQEYIAAAEKTLGSLSSPAYLADSGQNGYFILKHCVGSIPHNQEIDVPLNYADYYFLEGLLRLGKNTIK
jgi:rhamnogalacturonyl hydrolase YesR